MKRILIISHYAYFNERTGMTLLIRDLAVSLSELYDVTVITMKDKPYEPISIDNVRYVTGGSYSKSDYDHVIAHPPFNLGSDICLYDSVAQVGGMYDPGNLNPKLVIFTTNHIKESYNYTGKSIVMHPPVFPSQHTTTRGNHITIVGMTEHKGVRTAIKLSKLHPELQFMGVKSGWGRFNQIPYRSKNFTIMQQVEDMREVWRETSIVIAPSKSEQYGKASLEAMASGIPVIAYGCPGAREALGSGALFVDTLDIEAWDNALKHIIENYGTYSEKSYKQSLVIDSNKELDELVTAIEWI